MIIGVRKEVCASHILWRKDWSEEENQRVFGKCSRLHGHNWIIDVEVEGAVNGTTGMVINFAEISKVVMALDHGHLNDIAGLGLPTSENVTMYLIGQLRNLGSFSAIKVRVSETEHSYSEHLWRTC